MHTHTTHTYTHTFTLQCSNCEEKLSLTLQEGWQEGQELLVQQIMTTSPDGTEEASQQQEVVVGVLGAQGQLHGAVHQLVQMGL